MPKPGGDQREDDAGPWPTRLCRRSGRHVVATPPNESRLSGGRPPARRTTLALPQVNCPATQLHEPHAPAGCRRWLGGKPNQCRDGGARRPPHPANVFRKPAAAAPTRGGASTAMPISTPLEHRLGANPSRPPRGAPAGTPCRPDLGSRCRRRPTIGCSRRGRARAPDPSAPRGRASIVLPSLMTPLALPPNEMRLSGGPAAAPPGQLFLAYTTSVSRA
jgi:hypothetical protein